MSSTGNLERGEEFALSIQSACVEGGLNHRSEGFGVIVQREETPAVE